MLGNNSHTTLIASKKSGSQLVTITNLSILKNQDGKETLYKGNRGVVITFKNKDITHQELYWIKGFNYSKLLRLIKDAGVDSISSKELKGKELWIVLKHIVMFEAGEEIDRKVILLETSPKDKVPNYPLIIEEYEGDINNDEFPEF